ncbi:preQ(1) synthase [Chroococcidiopsis sp. TS-821]|uniref:preQ(1) synthase n=1 Tax=Chroococcidiopsis sp. TS-821 TaxID=1378066 RepID=UPI000CEDEE1A|nr:preQ(1) synthase [Chroococcidiopsis sp. TS-821]PPS45293.1 NADPH-dependent 7-cyano-7-deazaguanine reductase QueF [Chroococcidiopsis sp. TS-821]
MSNESSLVQSGTESLADDSETAQQQKYGERHIAEGKLITFPNPRIGRWYNIHITLPEFTCKCPFSGYPDFATIYITYVPNERVVELKSIKLYINSYRDRYISHEESINQILDDFVAACDPLEVQIKGDFNPRGNVHTAIEINYKREQTPIQNNVLARKESSFQ